MRLVIVTNIPAPYRMPLYERVDARLRETGGKLVVVYGAMTQQAVQWVDAAADAPTSVESVFLNRRPFRLGGRSTYVNPLVARELERHHPDVVVIGGFAPWTYAAAAWCRVRRRPYLIWSGETVATADLRGYRRGRRSLLLRGANGCLAYGPVAAGYLAAMGVRSPVTVVGNGIDYEAFGRLVDEARTRRDAIRDELGLTRPAILCVGGKNLGTVIAARSAMQHAAVILVVGADSMDRRPDILSLGKLPFARMPGVYAAGDVLAHVPRVDQWPHAINESIAAGIPIVASRDTGAPDEFFAGPGCSIVDGESGAVAAALDTALDVALRITEEERQAIRAAAAPWTVDRMAEQILDAVARAHR